MVEAVFRKVILELERMICLEKGISMNTKARGLKNGVFIEEFLDLLFTN